MSTRSMIGYKNDDGTVTGVYCHFDGYIEGVGTILQSDYRDATKVTSLLALGDISALHEEIGEPHNFDDRFPSQDPRCKWTRFYGRDRGEEGTEARTFETENAFWAARHDFGAEYQYLFSEGAWFVKEYDNEIKPLMDYFKSDKTHS